MTGPVHVREARSDEWASAGDICVAAYVADGLVTADDRYVEELRDTAGRTRDAAVLVAVDDSGRVLGAVTYCRPGSPYAELSVAGESEFRMLAVDPAARGQGAGRMLVEECLRRARDAGDTAVVLSTLDVTASAQRLYARLGFTRTPSRDWQPRPNLWLRAYRCELS